MRLTILPRTYPAMNNCLPRPNPPAPLPPSSPPSCPSCADFNLSRFVEENMGTKSSSMAVGPTGQSWWLGSAWHLAHAASHVSAGAQQRTLPANRGGVSAAPPPPLQAMNPRWLAPEVMKGERATPAAGTAGEGTGHALARVAHASRETCV